MKWHKSLLVSAVLICSLTIGFAQNKTVSKIVDEFGKVSNHDLQARVQDFKVLLYKNQSHGFIVLYGEKKYPLLTYINKRRIQGCLLMLNLNADNLSFIFTNDKSEAGGQFWESPDVSQKPFLNEIRPDYKLKALTNPYLIYRFNEYNADEFCPLFFDIEYYSRFLRANPNIIGKIIIHEETVKKFQKERLKHFRELTRKEKVSPKQISIVRGKYKGFSDTEFWLVPAKKR